MLETPMPSKNAASRGGYILSGMMVGCSNTLLDLDTYSLQSDRYGWRHTTADGGSAYRENRDYFITVEITYPSDLTIALSWLSEIVAPSCFSAMAMMLAADSVLLA